MRPMLLAPEAHAPTTAAWILPPAITAQLQKRMMAHATTPVAQAPDAAGKACIGMPATQSCIITPPSVAPDAECTLLNLQELAEGYQILMAQNAVSRQPHSRVARFTVELLQLHGGWVHKR